MGYISIRWHLRALMVNRLGICFIDNEAFRVALIKRSSQSKAVFLLVACLSLIDTAVSFGAWIERVPYMPTRQTCLHVVRAESCVR